MATDDARIAYWSEPAAATCAALASSERGLAGGEAALRLERHGANSFDEEPEHAVWLLFRHQLASPLVLILIAGAAVSLVLRDWLDAAIILAIVLGSVALGFAQEYRASAAVTALRQRLALTARVLRDGALQTVPASTLVPGDVVDLAAGNLVPADGIVLAARDFLVSEASLTGESFPVEKAPGIAAADAPLARRGNCVFAGTSVRSGNARVLVVETGHRTAFGAIATELAAQVPETEFARGIRDFGYLLVRVMIVMVLFVLVVNHALGRPVIESLLFATALAVGLSPELLPAIVSVTLAHGARKMSESGVIVRRLEAIENLGSIDVFCSDKTGTLTTGVAALAAAADPAGAPSADVLRLAFLNSALETGIENPLDAAIVAAGGAAGLGTAGNAKIDEIPYDFIRRRMTLVVAPDATPGTHLLVTKGAVANVLAACSTVVRDGREQALDPGLRASLDQWVRDQGAAGYRVLALATRAIPAKAAYDHADEVAMTLVGFLSFFDPPKPSAAAAIRDLAALAIEVKIITGDSRHVAAHVATAIGLDPGAMLTGEEVSRLHDDGLARRARRIELFVEVDPQQKERIVRALKASGHVVGYLGDGINDAPALRAADVGISVEGAADVARESADVVMLRPDLEVLRRGIEDGRRTFANTLKYIKITTSANFGNMVSMALATPLLPFLPLAAKQILLNNFLSDLPSMAIATDRVDREHIERAQRWDVGEVRRFMLVFGLVSTAFDLLTFGVLLHYFHASETTFQTAWFVVSLLTELAVLLVLRTRLPAWRSRPGALLLATTLAVGVLAVTLPLTGPAARVFGFVPLPWPISAALAGIVAGYVLCTEAVKLHLVPASKRRAARARTRA
jgi:Mg2+-importing ATPase